MNCFRKMKQFILEENPEIKVYKDKVNIVNYKDIGHFDNKKVLIYYNEGLIQVEGDNLVVSKLLDKEVLIVGLIKSVELR